MAGLSGVGDTFGTCFGPLSRNRNLGVRIGQGERLKDILASSTEVRGVKSLEKAVYIGRTSHNELYILPCTQVAEGVDTAFSLEKIILSFDRSYRTDLKFPIIFGVCQVRYTQQ